MHDTILHIKMQQKFSSLFAQCIIIHNVLYHELYCTCINDCWAAIRNKKKPHNRLSREFLKFIIVNLKQNQRPNFWYRYNYNTPEYWKKFKWPIKNRRFFYWFCSGNQRYFKVFWKDQDRRFFENSNNRTTPISTNNVSLLSKGNSHKEIKIDETLPIKILLLICILHLIRYLHNARYLHFPLTGKERKHRAQRREREKEKHR
jgi:hypothetical protein